MEPRLSVISLQVADVARSRAFYAALGWAPVGPEMDDVAFIQLNGVVLSLYAHQARDAGLEADGGAAPSPRIALGHNVRERDQVDTMLAAIAAAGGRITRPAHDTEWGGRSSYVADPDGHLFEIAWNPFWPIGADGGVTVKFD
jgi:catechol 2,3-dioxygenase-like lactoylglutathione lyase family enzyme